MLPRERVLATLNHQRTDRAPADYWAHATVTGTLIARPGVGDWEGLLQALQLWRHSPDHSSVDRRWRRCVGPDPGAGRGHGL